MKTLLHVLELDTHIWVWVMRKRRSIPTGLRGGESEMDFDLRELDACTPERVVLRLATR